ncbi:hypothetical protein KY290_014107 [Solanum tuberosum]|uniref:Uncharacterized protein n=2 Tax=Solanum tuberosum TaxID=4113 RepID=A0ABQ7VNP1_SOLTU|nr:hypothetical protein KY285_031711 [Solanum tuberosum]KAH0718946.1 hypothetical protein KY285_014977 [Solanum tuberosum]KAH0744498.1 hypothetical protein KY290_032491 [Solanum tuberosum]KAH0770126.1 hypothetical protein KY290_014107 [Solanum tuberosum]
MESNRKPRTGFMKGKLVKSLYRSAAPTHVASSPTNNYYSSFKDDDHSPPQTVYHLQLHHHQPKEKLVPFNPNNINTALSSSFIVNQDQAALPQKPKVSYYIPPKSNSINSTDVTNFDYAKMVDKSYGDESVDMKAAHYISCVQQRFRSLELTC